jgi:hypothetical protein
MTTKPNSVLNAIAISSLLIASGSATAGLMGDSVTASISALNESIQIPVASPQTVTAASEFFATVVDGFGQEWEITIDVMDMGFSVGFEESTLGGNGNISGPANLLHISLGSLDLGVPITNAIWSDYSCLSPGYSCAVGGPTISSGTWTATSADVFFAGVRSGELYTFEFNPETSVPEPGTLALLAVGALGAAVQRKRV